ncbi:MAG TPA: glycosyltransferase [Vicinamibacterales bacterium]|nr:glycosyltransferase [Vicinamibacterales bacterium]
MTFQAAAPAPGPGPLRVMHVVFSLQPGGMEHGVVKLANGLDPSQIASAICSTTPGGALRPLVSAAVPVYELRRRAGNDPSLIWQLYRVFRRARPHIVHTHAWGTLIEGLIAARLARVPVVIHGEHGTLQSRSYQLRVQRQAWSRVDRVLAVSSRLAEKLAAGTGFPLERIQVIRNGVDLSRFGSINREEARRALGIEQGSVVIGTAGRLVPVKDHATLLDALAILAAQGLRFQALIAGEGPLHGDLDARAGALGIADRVRFLGHRPDIERVFAALDVFVLSSSSEGLSNTILEAMASGVPVVATRVGGADELVEDGRSGFLVAPRAPIALAAGLQRFVAGRELRSAAGAAGRQRALTSFGIDRMLEDYRNLYCELGNGWPGTTQHAGARPVLRSSTDLQTIRND